METTQRDAAGPQGPPSATAVSLPHGVLEYGLVRENCLRVAAARGFLDKTMACASTRKRDERLQIKEEIQDRTSSSSRDPTDSRSWNMAL